MILRHSIDLLKEEESADNHGVYISTIIQFRLVSLGVFFTAVVGPDLLSGVKQKNLSLVDNPLTDLQKSCHSCPAHETLSPAPGRYKYSNIYIHLFPCSRVLVTCWGYHMKECAISLVES